MILNTRIEFNGLSTLARVDKYRGYMFIRKGDTAPSVGDTITHEGSGYEVLSVDRLDTTAGTRRIRVRLLDWQKPKPEPKPEPLADWERELLYGTKGPMPTPEIIKQVLGRTAGREVKAQIGANSDRHLKSLLGHAIVLAKKEMAEYHEREAQKRAMAKEKELGEAVTKASKVPLATASSYAILPPHVPEERSRPTVAETLEAVAYYVDNDAWEGRFERLVRSIRKPLQTRSPLASGGYVHGGAVPIGGLVNNLRGQL